MIHRQTPLQHHLFQVAVAQGISQVPPDTQEDDVGLEMTPLEGVLRVHERGGSGYRTSSISISTRAAPVFATEPERVDEAPGDGPRGSS